MNPATARVEPDAESLIASARGGDTAAFEAVYRVYSGRVFSVCLRMARDRDEATAFAQDAWIRAWERLETFRGTARFGTWMHRLTVNLIIDRRRADARWRSRFISPPEDQTPETWKAPAQTPGIRVDLERCVEVLPEGARTVFLLHDVEGFKQREIAERLGIAIGTVKSQLHHARRLLRKALER